MQKIILIDGKLKVIADNIDIAAKDKTVLSGEFTCDADVAGFIVALADESKVVTKRKGSFLLPWQSSEIYTKDEFVKQQDEKISSLEDEINELKTKLFALENKHEKAISQIRTKEKLIEEKEKTIELLKQRLDDTVDQAVKAVDFDTNGKYRMKFMKYLDGFRFKVERN